MATSMSDIHHAKFSNRAPRATRVYSGRNQEVLVRDSQSSRPLKPFAEDGDGTHSYFSWGQDSAAGKRLAAALLADALEDDKRATELANIFNARVISILPERWSMTRERILSYAELMRRQILDENLSAFNSPRRLK